MLERIVFDNFDDFIYFDTKDFTFYDARGSRIVSLKDVDDEFLEELKGASDGHEALCFLLIGVGYSIGKTAEDVLLDYYENDYVEASFGDTFAQAEIDELEENIDTMDEEQLIYAYNLIKIGEWLVKIGE